MLKRQPSFKLFRGAAKLVVASNRSGARTPGSGFRKKRSPRMRWKMAMIAVVAFLRLTKRKFFLLPREIEYIRGVYDGAEGINNLAKLSLILQNCGLQIPDDELLELLDLARYREGHMLSFRQFRIFFQTNKLQGSLASGVVAGSAEEAFKSIGAKPGQPAPKSINAERLRRMVDEFGLQLDVAGEEEELGLEEFSRVVVPQDVDMERDWWRQPDSDEWWAGIDEWMHRQPKRVKKQPVEVVAPATLEQILQLNLGIATGKQNPSRAAELEESAVNNASYPSMILTALALTSGSHGTGGESYSSMSPSHLASTQHSVVQAGTPLARDFDQSAADDVGEDPLDIATPTAGDRSRDSTPLRKAATPLAKRPATACDRPASKAQRWTQFMDRMEKDVSMRRSRPASAAPGLDSTATAAASPERSRDMHIDRCAKDCFSGRFAPSPVWREHNEQPQDAPSIHHAPFAVKKVAAHNKFQMRRPQTADTAVMARRLEPLAAPSAHPTTQADVQAPTMAACLSLWTKGGAAAGTKRRRTIKS